MKRKRGSTLTEMIIVMAIVAIMTLMVISFTVICNGWVHLGIERYRVTQSERSLSAALRDFVSYFDNSDFAFSVQEGGVLRATDKNDPDNYYEFSYDKEREVLSYQLPDKTPEYPMEYITDLKIYIRKSDFSDKKLINCYIAYALPPTSASVLSLGSYSIIVSTQS